MSAANPSSIDRDDEALRRAQRSYEPSMEEILASIRNMMADDPEADKAAPARAPASRPAASAPQIVFSKDYPASPRGVPRAPSPDDGKGRETAKLPLGTRTAWEAQAPADAQPALENLAALAADARAPAGTKEQAKAADPRLSEDEPLLSAEGGQAVRSAFEALSANLAAQGAEMAQEMAREMLRPLLKAWLDENLPDLVERLVRAEIDRVARGFR